MFVTFQYRGLHHLDMYYTLIIDALLKSDINFDCRYLELWNTCIFIIVLIVLNIRDGTESKYSSIVFLRIFSAFRGQTVHLIMRWLHSAVGNVFYYRSRGHKFDPGPSQTFVEIDHGLISTAILLPSADSRRVVVSYKRKYVHEVLVNRLVKLV